MNNEKMLKLWFFFLSKSKRVNGCICIKYRGQRYDKIVHAIAVRIRLLVLFRIMNLFWCYDVNAFPMLLWKKGEKIMKIWKCQVRLNERTNTAVVWLKLCGSYSIKYDVFCNCFSYIPLCDAPVSWYQGNK